MKKIFVAVVLMFTAGLCFAKDDENSRKTGISVLFGDMTGYSNDYSAYLNSFDFAKEDVLNGFRDMIQNPDSPLKNVRNDLDTELDNRSRIVVLSTCITNQKSSRY